jgi:hypothetical protein
LPQKAQSIVRVDDPFLLYKKPDGTTETVVDLSNLVVEQKTYVSAGTPVTVEYPKGQEPPPQELIDLLAR